MAKKITKLSDEKWAHAFALREQYRSFGLCTEPADRATTERLITGFYTRIGKPAPGFVWVDGPLSAILAFNLLKKLADPQLGSQLRSQLWSQLRSQLWSQLESQLGSQLRSQLWSQLRSQLESQLWSQLGSQLWSQLESQLWSQLGSQLWSQLRSQLGSQLGSGNLQFPDYFAGGEWISWVAFYVACRDVAGAKYADSESALLGEWDQLMRASGWWFPFNGLVICAERHRAVAFDAEKRLHCETGPAIECRDGFKVYAWHGTSIPADWIEKRSDLDPRTALTWQNVEQRRCAAEIIGWGRVLDQLKPTVVDADRDPLIGTLLRVDLPNSPREQFLKVLCGTGRTFVLPVPPDIKTALDANAWTYGVDPTVIRALECRT